MHICEFSYKKLFPEWIGFASDLVVNISCFSVQKEFRVIQTLSRDGTLKNVLECSQHTSFYRTRPLAADSCSV